MRRHSSFVPLMVFNFLALGTLSLYAQVTTGAIDGFVTDSSGAFVPGVTVTVVNTDTNYTRTTASQSDGSFSALLLPPGRYRLTFSKAGFETLVQDGVQLAVSQTARADAKLTVGTVNQRVTVSAHANLVDTQSVQLSSQIGEKALADLPVMGNQFVQLVALSPGILPIAQSEGVNISPISNYFSGKQPEAAGGRFNETDIQFDSSHYRNNYEGTSSNLPSSRSLEEFQVVRNTFSAEYGLTSALVINAVTKSGKNSIHGEGYDTWGNNILNTRQFTAGATVPIERYNQFGGNVGGPVRFPFYNGRDRTFFFFSYEGIREPSAATLSGGYPPTAQEKTGDFSDQSIPIIDPTTNQQFPGNIIPLNRFDPVGLKVMNLLPAANFGTQFRANVPDPSTENQYITRIDHNISAKSHIFGRLFLDRPNSTAFASNVIVPGINTGVISTVHNVDLAVNHIYNFSAEMVNQLTFGMNRTPEIAVIPPNSYIDLGITGLTGLTSDPTFFFTQSHVNVNPEYPSIEGSNTWQFSDTLSWIHGRQTTKFGFSYSKWDEIYTSGINGEDNGDFYQEGTYTGLDYADTLLGYSTTFQNYDTPPLNTNMKNVDGYVQDDIKVRPGLTANLGLRYFVSRPYTSNLSPKLGGTFIPGEQSTVIPSAPLGMVYIGDKGVPPSIVHTDWHDFSPRVGVAYDPTGKGTMSIRAGYGIYYNIRPAEFAYTDYQPPYGIYTFLTPPYRVSNPFGTGTPSAVPNPYPYVYNPSTVQFFPPITLYPVLDPNMKNQYTQSWDLVVQRQVRGVMIEVGYIGNVGHRLNSAYDANPANYIPGNGPNGQPLSTPSNTNDRRIYDPGVLSTILYMTDYANSNYNSLQVSAKGHLTKSLLMTTAWTWGHSLDNGSSSRYDTYAVNNPWDREANYGNSDFDVRHILNGSLVWDLPRLDHQPAAVRGILGGWNLSPLFKAQSGGWATAYNGEDRSLSGGYYPYDRATQVLKNIYLPSNRSNGERFAEWINPAAFELSPVGTFGNVGRNTILGPARWVADLALHKTIKLHENAALRIDANVYNVFNHVRLGTCQGFLFGDSQCGMTNFVNSPTFGAFSTAESGRQIELGATILF